MADVVDRYRSRLGRPSRAFAPTQETIDVYLATWTQAVTPAPGLESCLQDLSRDHRLVIVSNAHDPNLVPELSARFGIADHVDAIVSSVAVGWRKPHPEIFRLATGTVGAEPRDVVFVGDSWGPDVEGPLAAGMHAVFVGSPAAVRDDTVPVVDSLSGVPDAVRAVRSTSAPRR